ncbi:MAG TPA: hypothetical protein VE944_02595 [Nostoc sp.]|uniref:hypothetical protein n=1 Tax=Nostoc sp. TaxID=1180 RepID=UPI002D408F6B|nr:hypothetical protein [Nostoc sp.]HYX13255.1 hypothetical protein [Nostoc sp.]
MSHNAKGTVAVEKRSKGLPTKKIINRLGRQGEQGKQGEKNWIVTLDVGIE